MSEENAEEDGRINHASGIIAAAKGKIKITEAMKLVGFSTPERKNITVYQRVRRRSQQLTVVSIAPRTIKKSSLFEVESALSSAEESVTNSRVINVDTDSNRASRGFEAAVTPRRLDTDTGTSPESNTTGDTATTGAGAETRAGVASSGKRVTRTRHPKKAQQLLLNVGVGPLNKYKMQKLQLGVKPRRKERL